jgi:hypothetical protein
MIIGKDEKFEKKWISFLGIAHAVSINKEMKKDGK